MSEFRKVITKPGEVIPYETVFEENCCLRTGVPSKMGTVDRLEYDTAVYENGKTYHKYAYVYLPWCYNAEDKTRKYNVLYFQHGNTCDPDMFAVGGNKYMFDMLFDSGELDPSIIVFVTYYMDPMRDAAVRTITGQVEAGDGETAGIPGNFDREIVRDIIPAVELKYNTWLSDASDDGIRATRDHRAFAGYSRGAVWTWRMFHHALEYFRWFCPTSCGTTCGVRISGHSGPGLFPDFTDREIVEYVTAPVRAHPGLPFFIYAGCGGTEDMPSAYMYRQLVLMCGPSEFSYGPDPAKNNLLFTVSDYYHTDYLVPYYFWNYLKLLFKGI